MDKRIIIGTGTGRCGTVTLSRVLGAQINCLATHEEHPLLPWNKEVHDFGLKANALESRPSHFCASVSMDWGRYLQDALDRWGDAVRVVVMKRDIDETVRSYMAKTGGDKLRNHWTDEPDPTRKVPLNVWDRVYPSYSWIPPEHKEHAIRQYVIDWREQVPKNDERIAWFDYGFALNDYDTQMEMLRFCGFTSPVAILNSINNETRA